MLFFFFPKNFIGGKLQNIYSTMFTVTICSELIPQNILQLKLTYLVTFKNLLLSKVVQSTLGAPTVPTYKLKRLLIPPPSRKAWESTFLPFYIEK